jgi:predicted 3-demethylubiquinone-9 3-methyltransferase (glyoxalase superfamily)
MTNITPFLWFEDSAEVAMEFYVSLFEDAKVLSVHRAGDDGPVFSVSFSIGSQTFTAINGGPHYTLTPATSWMITCESQEEIDRLWGALSEGGEPMQCGWITDRFGVTWQIVPSVLFAYLSSSEPGVGGRVQEAMLKMTKFEISGLEAAAKG